MCTFLWVIFSSFSLNIFTSIELIPLPHSAMSAGSDIPSLLPGNGSNRDACQAPGGSVHSQACYYMADNEAPVFSALRPALVADMAVVRGVVDRSKSLGLGSPCALYALITHPGHHAGRANSGGYCYINSAAVIVQTLRAEMVFVVRLITTH